MIERLLHNGTDVRPLLWRIIEPDALVSRNLFERIGGWLRLRLKFAKRALPLIGIASFCRRCGRTVHDFDAPDEVWEAVRVHIKQGNTLCYDCFCELCARNGLPTVWRLVGLDEKWEEAEAPSRNPIIPGSLSPAPLTCTDYKGRSPVERCDAPRYSSDSSSSCDTSASYHCRKSSRIP